jgi:hypothetical protein
LALSGGFEKIAQLLHFRFWSIQPGAVKCSFFWGKGNDEQDCLVCTEAKMLQRQNSWLIWLTAACRLVGPWVVLLND